MPSTLTDEAAREIWREGMRSTGPVPKLGEHGRFDIGITAGLRAVADAAADAQRTALISEITRLRNLVDEAAAALTARGFRERGEQLTAKKGTP